MGMPLKFFIYISVQYGKKKWEREKEKSKKARKYEKEKKSKISIRLSAFSYEIKERRTTKIKDYSSLNKILFFYLV